MKYRKVYLKEDLDPSLPSWLIKKLKSENSELKRALLKRDVALDKVKFIQSDFPSTSNQVTKMKEVGKWPIFLINNRDVYMPGIYGDNDWNFKKNTYYKNTPMKDIIANSTDFGYIDLNLPSNLSLDIKAQRKQERKDVIPRGKGQYLYKETEYIPGGYDDAGRYKEGHYRETGEQEWKLTKGQDKSGYLLNPDKYKNMLDEMGLNNYSIILDKYYNKLNNLKSKIQNKLNDWDIKSQIPRFGKWGTSLYSILEDFADAAGAYSQILQGIEKIINKPTLNDDQKREYIKDYSTGYHGISYLRETIKDLQKDLEKEYKIDEI